MVTTYFAVVKKARLYAYILENKCQMVIFGCLLFLQSKFEWVDEKIYHD